MVIHLDLRDIEKYFSQLELDFLLLRAALMLPIERDFLLSVSLVDEETIQALNLRFRNQDKITDVLSFAYEESDADLAKIEGERYLGDILICEAVARRQALFYQHSMRKELIILLTHGFLHLLGYDHQEAHERRKMLALQQKLVESLYD